MDTFLSFFWQNPSILGRKEIFRKTCRPFCQKSLITSVFPKKKPESSAAFNGVRFISNVILTVNICFNI